MKKEITNRKIAYNTMMSVAAQAISLITSIVINLIVPKFIDEYQYSYWQTYVLYASYVGILHFGLPDGIVLRYSQYDYDELDKRKYGFHFYFLFAMLLAEMAVVMTVGNIFFKNQFKAIAALVAVSIISKNLFTFASYSFQVTNRIPRYAISVITQRLFYGIVAVILLAVGAREFYYFCFADICADLFGFILSVPANKEIFTQGVRKTKEATSEVIISMKAGIFLMVANFSSNFIVGSAKVVIQTFWPTLVFGQAAFGFSITNFFLSFVTAISVVLFPSLKRMDEGRLPKLYQQIRSVLTPLLITIMILFYPACVILGMWLPNYSDSLMYAGLLLPIIIYTTRASLLTNNYLKTYRKEKQMLVLNLGCIVGELIGLGIIYARIRSIEAILIWTIVISAARSIGAELIVSKLIHKNFIKDIIAEIIMVAIFMTVTMNTTGLSGSLMYGIALIIYYIYKREAIRAISRRLMKRKTR